MESPEQPKRPETAHPGFEVRRPAQPMYRVKLPKELTGERPVDAVRWLGAGFGLAIMVLTVLGILWIAVSGVGTGRWIWEPAPPKSPVPVASASPRETVEPTDTPSPEPSPSPTPTNTAGKGTIKGAIGFPAGSAPSQTVCAESTTNAANRYCTDYLAGSSLTYTIAAPAGTYYVYARLKAAQGDFTTSYRAYYNKYVTCGLQASCPASLHAQYVPVTVTVGATTSGVDPVDWYNTAQ